ncbi:MAG: hypothetical protein KJ726_06320 [Verrucomicrobia bacterium]|nr:hypothetical protein [Verrucomicrobiota bacterium]MBU1909641.1 hypothetical protein [Verrucomicrobiota bacterium]
MKRIMCVAALIVALSAVAAMANNGWGLYGAWWEGGDAFGPGFKLTFELVPALQFDFHVAYFNDVGEGDTGLNVTPLEFGLAMNVPVTETVKLSLGGGPSYNFVDGGSDDEIGGYIGGCLEFAPYKDVALFLEARYVILDVGPEDLNGLGLNAGLMVTW